MNYRSIKETNFLKTRVALSVYLLIMLVVGLLLDVVIGENGSAHRLPLDIGFLDAIVYLATFKVIPYATIALFSITFISILIINKYGDRLIMVSLEAKNLYELENPTHKEVVLMNILDELSISAGLGYTPKLYIIQDSSLNAFAAGWNEKNTIVAVHSGLVDALNRAEMQAVLGHEVGHILNGDSKLSLYVGILSNLLLTVVDIFTHVFLIKKSRENSNANLAMLIIFILNICLPFITYILNLFLSRKREYLADATSVELTNDPRSLANALLKIESLNHSKEANEEDVIGDRFRRPSYIYNKNADSIFSTHPTLQNRINILHKLESNTD